MNALGEVFALPSALWGLLLAPPCWWWLRRRDRRRARRTAAWLGPRARHLAAEAPGAARRATRRALFALGLAAAALAVAQPRFGTAARGMAPAGLDVMLCLDVSRSMLARDLEPDRLRRAQREIEALAAAARGDRLGLVLFAGEGRLRVPLTRDLDSLAELAALAEPTSVSRGGTDLGAAIDTAAHALRTGRGEADPDDRGAAIVLLTDGEDRGQRGRRAAARCAARGVTVHCLGIGTALGSKIALRRDGTETFLRDRDGNEVVSRLEARSLRLLADAGGGAYFDVRHGPQPLVDLYRARILPAVRRAHAGEERSSRPHRFQWPLGAALLAWLLGLALELRRRTPR